jgi:hypothetical protein
MRIAVSALALSLLLLAGLLAVRDHGRTTSRQTTPAAVPSGKAGPPLPGCARAIIRDWLPDDRVDGIYPRRCFKRLRRFVHLTDYGASGLVDAVYAAAASDG